jgi:hypothetical protein
MNWAATRIMCDPFGPLRDAWGAEVEEDQSWTEAVVDGLDEDLKDVAGLLNAERLEAIELGDGDWEPTAEDD